MVKVLILDQFCGLSSNRSTVPFKVLVDQAFAQYAQRDAESRARCGLPAMGSPKLKEVSDDFQPPMCTSVYRENAAGMAELWRYNWDSSG